MGHPNKFDERIERAVACTSDGRPLWGRIPRTGTRCPWTGLSRTYICRLVHDGSIESRLLLRPGCVTGVRLVYLPSIEAYISGANSRHLNQQDHHQ